MQKIIRQPNIMEIFNYIQDCNLYCNNIISKKIDITCANLARKKVNNEYNNTLAVKSFVNVVILGIKEYCNKYCNNNFRWYDLANIAERESIAAMLLKENKDLIQSYYTILS